jgi:D-glycero-alpha-D-manno-heptose-7-phosphate kinase
VNPLRIRPETLYELEYALVFAYVGGTHFSNIIDAQVSNYERREADAVAAMDRIKELASEMKRALLTDDLRGLGALLDEAWQAKRRMAAGISNERLDAVYEAAMGAGALGGKVSGAGGGGFMFFLADPDRKFAVQEAVAAHGADLVPLTFVEEGVRTWTA